MEKSRGDGEAEQLSGLEVRGWCPWTLMDQKNVIHHHWSITRVPGRTYATMRRGQMNIRLIRKWERLEGGGVHSKVLSHQVKSNNREIFGNL